MVAKVIIGKGINGTLSYNEEKVRQELAVCIEANQFPAQVSELTFAEKLSRFTKLLELKPTVKTNTLHIILSFSPEDDLRADRLHAIYSGYMDKIGFGDQPYLVYRHLDTEHPHVHIVTTNITPEGKAIDLHNIGRIRSTNARKELEAEFNLTRAEGRQQPMGRAHDLRSSVRLALEYKVTSLAELNIVLAQYNVMADRGREGSLIHRKHGLVYSMIDGEGKRVGKAIKASRISKHATLPAIEKKFADNLLRRLAFKVPLRHAIDKAVQQCNTLHDLSRHLESDGIKAIIRKNPAGMIYGVSFIDTVNACVFKGSDLGKAYSAKALQDRMRATAGKAKGGGEKKVVGGKGAGVGTMGGASPRVGSASPKGSAPRAAQPVKPLRFDKPDYVEPLHVVGTPHTVEENEQVRKANQLLADLIAGTAGANTNVEASLRLSKRKRRKRKKRL